MGRFATIADTRRVSSSPCVARVVSIIAQSSFDIMNTLSRLQPLTPSLHSLSRSQQAFTMSAFVPLLPDSKKMKEDALAFEGKKQYEKANEKYDELLDEQTKTIGASHPDTVETMMSIERCIEQLKNKEGSESMYESAFACSDGGRHGDAFKIWEQKLSMELKSKGSEHEDTLITMGNIAGTFDSLGQFKEALAMGQRVLPIRLRVSGDEHPETLRIMANIASSLNGLDRYNDALEMILKVMEVQSRTLGEEDPATIQSIYNVAMTQYNLLRYDESHQNASRGLLLAQKTGDKERATIFVELLSRIEILKKYDDSSTSDEQRRLMEKILDRKIQIKEKTALMAKAAATPHKPTTEKELDDLMKEFELEDEGGRRKATIKRRPTMEEGARSRGRRRSGRGSEVWFVWLHVSRIDWFDGSKMLATFCDLKRELH
jgi:tetratricopeptide (TPR) repeat protein